MAFDIIFIFPRHITEKNLGVSKSQTEYLANITNFIIFPNLPMKNVWMVYLDKAARAIVEPRP